MIFLQISLHQSPSCRLTVWLHDHRVTCDRSVVLLLLKCSFPQGQRSRKWVAVMSSCWASRLCVVGLRQDVTWLRNRNLLLLVLVLVLVHFSENGEANFLNEDSRFGWKKKKKRWLEQLQHEYSQCALYSTFGSLTLSFPPLTPVKVTKTFSKRVQLYIKPEHVVWTSGNDPMTRSRTL